ncbi:rhodopsin, GQ-coupled-like [Mizuhopecten yessoensis]|uniref:Rhodopsin, GQ-coupled n=1 Tax=Mizuhopecten yessoensis TaxID=6573 RepID=A0A210PWW1_MIZYE|nr:rhodopsin, GQ-coupled-like [Mizuhopecten yessoensis]OWF40988.1 Rhodopsin, GQ-coupled [Mizuhopecten yessoensis]
MVLGVTELATENTTHLYDTYDYFVHPHWKQFDPVPHTWHYFIGIFISIVGVSGVIGNIVVITMFSTTKTLKSPSNMLIVNLALSDLTFSAVNGFPLLTVSAFNTKWVFGDTACQFYGLIGGIFGLMSINTLAMISIDRCICITRPLQAMRIMTRKTSFIMIVVVWVWAVGWSLLPLFGLGAYIPEGFQTSCTFDYLTKTVSNRIYIIGMYVFAFALPLVLIIVSYIMIISSIRKHAREMANMADKMNAEEADKHEKTKAEIKITKIAMTLISLFILSWSPYATIALIAQFGDPSFVTPLMSEMPVMLAKSSAMHNPIVYALSHPKFRAALYQKAPCFLNCCKPSPKPPAEAPSRAQVGRTASDCSQSTIASSYGPGYEMQPTMNQGVNSGELVKELVGAIVSMANNQPPTVQPVFIPGTGGTVVTPIAATPAPAPTAEQVQTTTAAIIEKATKEPKV